MEGDAVPLDEALEAVVIRDHAGDLDVEFLRLPARQQVVEAVFLLRHQHHDALLDRRIADAPVHLQIAGEWLEAAAELGEVEGQGVGLDLDAHEVAPVQVVGVEARFEDPAAVLGDEAGDARNDADLVRAGGGQRVVACSVHQIRAEALSISARSSA
jgi:hypothetical protein